MGNFDQCSSCSAKLEQHCIKCLCIHHSPIIKHLVHKNISALHLSAFSQKFLIVACCTSGKFKIITLTASRFKNQTNHTIAIISKDFLNKKFILSIIAVLKKYWVRWLYVCSSPIIKLLFHTKIGDLLRNFFLQKLPNYGLSYFW